MNCLSLICVLWMVASPTAGEADMTDAAGAMPKLLATRQNVFSIPFRVDPPVQGDRGPTEVELYASADSGANWHFVQKVSAEKGHFLFRAGGEGEYWFSIRTIGRSRQVGPPRIETPGLRVVVDRTAPVLEIHADEDPSGAINVQWQFAERYPDLDTFKIQYRADPSGSWQDVLIDHESSNSAGSTCNGRVSWSVGMLQGSTHVEIRAELADTAGNRGVTHGRVALTQNASSTPPPTDYAFSDEDAHRVGAARGGESSAGWRSSSASPPVASTEQGSSPPPGEPWEISRYTSSAGDAVRESGSSGEEVISGISPNTAVSGQLHPRVQSQYVPSTEATETPSPLGPPEGQDLRMVNATEFELEYEVATNADVAQVELWVTRDGGQSWRRHGADEDGQSPMLASVNDEGVYGFRIVPVGAQAIPSQTPRSGQTPDLWIAVDLTSPQARIISADEGREDQAGKLVIRWEAEDGYLAAQPVSLFFQETRGGPWSVIAMGLENVGQYVWPMDMGVSETIYLRLEVRDQAGNLGVDEAAQPILLGGARPPVQIRDVRPVHHDVAEVATDPASGMVDLSR
jgi:hypothetical protein